jgi:hypothetical protein
VLPLPLADLTYLLAFRRFLNTSRAPSWSSIKSSYSFSPQIWTSELAEPCGYWYPSLRKSIQHAHSREEAAYARALNMWEVFESVELFESVKESFLLGLPRLTKCWHVPILFFFPYQQKSVLHNCRGKADLRPGSGQSSKALNYYSLWRNCYF